MNISKATKKDIPQLEILINKAYRGEESKKGWTNEAHILEGKRIDAEEMQKIISEDGVNILKYGYNAGEIIACVYLKKNTGKMYLGMLTVSPHMQAQGIGKKLLLFSEEFAKQNDCNIIEMTVFSVRSELIEWYERHGYIRTGKSLPYTPNHNHGVPKLPLEFIVLEKPL
jgi:N-acetylglutamate synthase-like GNAT family acetyltransferase